MDACKGNDVIFNVFNCESQRNKLNDQFQFPVSPMTIGIRKSGTENADWSTLEFNHECKIVRNRSLK